MTVNANVVPTSAAPRPGEKIGDKYVVIKPIAEGGMAHVVVARHIGLDEIVAIKILKPEFVAQTELVARFAREAKAVMQIRSEHSVRIMDVGLDTKVGPFIVMEHLEGSDLGLILHDEGPLPVRRAADLMLQVCDAVAHAHVLEVIHRDLKPENIFVLRHGNIEVVRVLDFGISKTSMTGRIFDTDLSVSTTQSLMGSPVYMSPEQMRMEDVDPRSDVWSLGATLYEMVTNQVAFAGTNVTEVCASVLEKEPRPLPPEVPEALAAVIMKCLRKDPSERFQNIGELALAIMPFAPSRSRLWAERAVSILNAHGANVDVSSFKSVPPPSDSSLIPPTPSDSLVPSGTRRAADRASSIPVQQTTTPTLPTVPIATLPEAAFAPKKKSSTWVVALIAIAAVAAGVGIFLFLQTPKKTADIAPAVATATTTAPPSEPPVNANVVAVPAATTAAVTSAQPARGNAAQPRWAKPKALAASASAAASQPPLTQQPPVAAPTTNATRSAIDDRK